MKLTLLSLENKELGKVDAPDQFYEPVRLDLIQRAVLALQANARQAYGAFPEAGKRASAELSRRRRKYRGSYGHGISRVPRKILSRRGTQFNWVGAFAPGMVGGRRAHPPKADKIWHQKMNEKERRKAIRSALAATFQSALVKERGHMLPKEYPVVVEDNLQALDKTKKLASSLIALGFGDDLARASERTIRAGKGKARGRRYITKKSVLIVVSEDCPVAKAGSNLLGVDVVEVNHLNAELLAPGCHPGRLTLFTKSALELLKEKKFFMNAFKGEKQVKTKKVSPKKKAVKKEAPKKVEPKKPVEEKVKSND